MTPAALTVTASNASKSYGQTPTLSAFSSNGLQNGETIGSVSESSAGTAVKASVSGSPYVITPSGATGGSFNAGNYTITYANGSLTVTPAALTVTASNASKSYGQTPTLSAFSSNGLQNGETIGSVSESSAGTAVKASVSGSPYVITPSGATGGSFNVGNYTITYANGSLTVTPAPLTVTAGNAGKTYDGLAYNGGNGVTYSGFVNGEGASVVGGTLVYTGSSQGARNAGSYLITPSGLTAGGNYTVTFVNGQLLIDKAHLTVTADDKTRLIGEANPVLTATLSGFVNGESAASAAVSGSAALSTSADDKTPVGTAAIKATQGTLLAGNYDFKTFVDGTLTINAVFVPPPAPASVLSLPGASAPPAVSVTMVREASLQQAGIITVSVPRAMATAGSGFSFALPAEVLESAGANTTIQVTTSSGQELPAWLKFDPVTKIFNASAVPDGALPMEVVVTVGGKRSTIVISERTE